MLPHNRLGRAMGSKLKVYAGPEHPHAAQKPVPLRDSTGEPVTSPDDATDQPEVNDTRRGPDARRSCGPARGCRRRHPGVRHGRARCRRRGPAEVEVDVETRPAPRPTAPTSDDAETDDAESRRLRRDRARAGVRPIDRPIQTVGRRKEAIVRVRLVPGTGRIVVNGKAFEEYFPNKVHQQLIREPLVITERTEQFDVFATLHGGGTSGQAGALRLGHRPRPHRGRPGRPSGPEEGRLPHPRPAGHGAQEVRPQEGPEGSSVLEALMARLFGTDGVRGLANADLSPELATAVSAVGRARARRARPGRRSAWCPGSRPLAVVGRDPRASGEMLEAAVTAGLSAAGADVLRVGVLPTPGRRVPDRRARRRPRRDDLGVAQPDARQRHQALRRRRAQAARRRRGRDRGPRPCGATPTPRPTGHDIGRVRDVPDALERYVAHLASATPTPLTGCTSSSTARTAPRRRPRPARTPRPARGSPRCTPTPTAGTSTTASAPRTWTSSRARSSREGADLGIAHDGDADRCLAVAADGTRRRRRPDPRDPRARHARARRARGGHPRRHRDEQPRPAPRHGRRRRRAEDDGGRRPLRPRGAALRAASRSAASSPGTSCCPAHATTGDGLLTALRLMARDGAHRTAARRPRRGDDARCPRCSSTCPSPTRPRWAPRRRWPTRSPPPRPSSPAAGRVLLRPSGTEQLVRVMVEAPTQVVAGQVADRLAGLVSSVR